MKKIFDMDNPLMTALAIAADLIILNLLTMALCIPVLTAGPAITAMNDIVIRIVNEGSGEVMNPYFRSLASNFKKGFLLGLVLILTVIVLYFHYVAVMAVLPSLVIMTMTLGIMALAVFFYAFALLARYENTVKETLRNAGILAIAHFPRTLYMVVFAVGLWAVGITFIRIGAPLMFMFGFSLPCYMNALLLKEVFSKLESEQEENPESASSENESNKKGSIYDKQSSEKGESI